MVDLVLSSSARILLSCSIFAMIRSISRLEDGATGRLVAELVVLVLLVM